MPVELDFSSVEVKVLFGIHSFTLSAYMIPALMSMKPFVLPSLILSTMWYFSTHFEPNLLKRSSSSSSP